MCPGVSAHSQKGGKRDFKVVLEGVPTGFCFHSSCGGAVEDFNRELRSRIGKLECGNGSGRDGTGRRFYDEVAAPAGERQGKRLPLCRKTVMGVVHGMPAVDRAWLRRRSPVDVSAVGVEGFLRGLYGAGERVLVFTRFTSQGDYLYEIPNDELPNDEGRPGRKTGGGWRLADKPGVKAVRAGLPDRGREGVWFLGQPVDGGWHPVKQLSEGGRKLSRRSEAGVKAWRYLVLESDELEEHLWLRVLAKLPLPVAAVYTSGGKSIHALVRVDAGGKAEWDAYRDAVSPVLTKLGADGAAMTGVRLTRLPFCLRLGFTREGRWEAYETPRRQELLWLDPGVRVDAGGRGRALVDFPELR